jgi:hypothetical protein
MIKNSNFNKNTHRNNDFIKEAIENNNFDKKNSIHKLTLTLTSNINSKQYSFLKS